MAVYRILENDLNNIKAATERAKQASTATTAQGKTSGGDWGDIEGEVKELDWEGISWKALDTDIDRSKVDRILKLLKSGNIDATKWDKVDGSNYPVVLIDDLENITGQVNNEPVAYTMKEGKLQKQESTKGSKFVDTDTEKFKRKFEEEQLKDNQIVFLGKDKYGDETLLTEEEAQKLASKNGESYETYKGSNKDKCFRIQSRQWDEQKGYKVDLVNVSDPSKKKTWQDKESKDINYKRTGSESGLLNGYWEEKILNKTERAILKGELKVPFNEIFKRRAQTKFDLSINLIPSYAIMHNDGYKATYQSEVQQLEMAKVFDANKINFNKDYFKFLVEPAVMVAQNWKFGVKCIIYVIYHLPQRVSSGLSDEDITEILNAFIKGNKLQEDEILIKIINAVGQMKESGESITTHGVLDVANGTRKAREASAAEKAEKDKAEKEITDKGKYWLAYYLASVYNDTFKKIPDTDTEAQNNYLLNNLLKGDKEDTLNRYLNSFLVLEKKKALLDSEKDKDILKFNDPNILKLAAENGSVNGKNPTGFREAMVDYLNSGTGFNNQQKEKKPRKKPQDDGSIQLGIRVGSGRFKQIKNLEQIKIALNNNDEKAISTVEAQVKDLENNTKADNIAMFKEWGVTDDQIRILDDNLLSFNNPEIQKIAVENQKVSAEEFKKLIQAYVSRATQGGKTEPENANDSELNQVEQKNTEKVQ